MNKGLVPRNALERGGGEDEPGNFQRVSLCSSAVLALDNMSKHGLKENESLRNCSRFFWVFAATWQLPHSKCSPQKPILGLFWVIFVESQNLHSRGPKHQRKLFLYKMFQKLLGHGSPCRKSWTSALTWVFLRPVMGKNFLTPGHPGMRVENVCRKFGPQMLCLCCFSFPDFGVPFWKVGKSKISLESSCFFVKPKQRRPLTLSKTPRLRKLQEAS